MCTCSIFFVLVLGLCHFACSAFIPCFPFQRIPGCQTTAPKSALMSPSWNYSFLYALSPLVVVLDSFFLFFALRMFNPAKPITLPVYSVGIIISVRVCCITSISSYIPKP
ncbi:hypothetical protein B0H34DRAFT_226052 [Crassisporium funariophilum]|nr:hypothetical protein B0H34DRAFT_226052 [Crassisporium funariophilum]